MFNSRFLFVRFLILLFSLPEILSAQNSGSGNSPSSTSFSFTLKTNATTSAGVYGEDGSLIRTLWSGVKYSTGTYKETWDGKDEMGKTVAEKKFEIKVLSNNVQYEWEGASIGNTSTNLTGDTKLRSYDFMRGMVVTGTKMYQALGYNEGFPAQWVVSTSDPNSKSFFGRMKSTDQTSNFVATDDVNVYWGGHDGNESYETFVYATKVSDNTQVTFSSGVPAVMGWGGTYNSTISYVYNSAAIITGMAVQKTGNYLFVSRAGLNQLQVLNKTTGAVAQTLTYTTPGYLCVDGSNNLWMLTGTNTITKYTVGGDGTLTAGITLSGITEGGAMAVSPDGTTLVVCDMGSSQLKAYNNSTGVSSWTYGTAGGYSTDATVNNNKFFWRNTVGSLWTYISFHPDGSFWVGDAGNFRTQHFSANRFL